MKMSYRTDQPELAQVGQALDAVARQSGNHVLEHGSDRAERQEAARPSQPGREASQQLERWGRPLPAAGCLTRCCWPRLSCPCRLSSSGALPSTGRIGSS